MTCWFFWKIEQSNFRKRTWQLTEKRTEKKNVAVKKRKLLKKKRKLIMLKKKIDKSEMKHMHTIDKKNMKKKLKLLKLKHLLLLIIIKWIFFFFRSHRINNEILLDMKKWNFYINIKLMFFQNRVSWIQCMITEFIMMIVNWIFSTILIEIRTFLIIALM